MVSSARELVKEKMGTTPAATEAEAVSTGVRQRAAEEETGCMMG
jgi:hypothetical protein